MRPMTVGCYTPTKEFLEIPEHVAVMDAETSALIAVTGPGGDAESRVYAELFAAAGEITAVVDRMGIAIVARAALKMTTEIWQIVDPLCDERYAETDPIRAAQLDGKIQAYMHTLRLVETIARGKTK